VTSRDPAAPDPDEPDGPEPHPEGPRDLDAEFDAIVAGLDLDEGSGDEPGPADDGDDSAAERDRPRADGSGSFEELRAWIDVHPDLLADHDEAEGEDLEPPPGPEDHFVPPPPPPVPRGDAVARWAWGGAIGAPVVYILLALLGFDTGGVVGVALIAGFVLGFVTLVVRMKDGPRVDDGPDDGAVV
jgi:hypothetical protein